MISCHSCNLKNADLSHLKYLRVLDSQMRPDHVHDAPLQACAFLCSCPERRPQKQRLTSILVTQSTPETQAHVSPHHA